MLAIMHSAAGAWLSKAARTRREAILLGLVSHAVLDFLGHEEPFDEHDTPRLAVLLPDIALTVPTILWWGARRGWLSPGFLASMASILPDAEHLPPLRREKHEKLFPSHRFHDLLHSKTRAKLSVELQLLLGGVLWLLLALRQRGAQPG